MLEIGMHSQNLSHVSEVVATAGVNVHACKSALSRCLSQVLQNQLSTTVHRPNERLKQMVQVNQKTTA